MLSSIPQQLCLYLFFCGNAIIDKTLFDEISTFEKQILLPINPKNPKDW